MYQEKMAMAKHFVFLSHAREPYHHKALIGATTVC
jgi:hypothetical protein